MVAKVGLGIIGLSAISVGGVALNSPWLLGMDDTMPEWHSLSEDNGFSGAYSGKYGEKYGKYLVGVTNQGKANGEKHKSWWEWAYRRLSKVEGRAGKFGAVEKGYAEDGDREKEKALNQICKSAYGTEDSSGNFDEGDVSGTKFKKSDVWKYCSIGGIQPKTLKEETEEKYDSEKIGHGDTERTKLLATKGDHNDWIWDLKDKEFRTMSVTEGFFKTEKEKTGSDKKSIKDICKDAYGKKDDSGEEQNKLTKAGVLKYCSLEGK